MRALSIFLYVLTGLFALLWAFGYVYVSGLACAFSGPAASQNCSMKMPWELDSEAFTMMVTFPLVVFVLLAVLGFLAARSAKNTASTAHE